MNIQSRGNFDYSLESEESRQAKPQPQQLVHLTRQTPMKAQGPQQLLFGGSVEQEIKDSKGLVKESGKTPGFSPSCLPRAICP